jgi:hypothetical protein
VLHDRLPPTVKLEGDEGGCINEEDCKLDDKDRIREMIMKGMQNIHAQVHSPNQFFV